MLFSLPLLHRSLAPVLDWLLIPGGKDILDFEEAGIALGVA